MLYQFKQSFKLNLDYINTIIRKAKLKFANKLINYYSQLNELVNQQTTLLITKTVKILQEFKIIIITKPLIKMS